MKSKQIITTLLLASLPVVALAATSENMPVTKAKTQGIPVINSNRTTVNDGGATTATTVSNDAISAIDDSTVAVTSAEDSTNSVMGPIKDTKTQYMDHNSITYRVSATATPEQNRHMHDVAGTTVRNVTDVVAPDANAYYDRKQVGVSPVVAATDHLDLVFPAVTSVSPVVQENINKVIKKYATKVQNDTIKLNESNADKTNVMMYYDVKTDAKGLFSVLIYTYTIRDKAANGINFEKGFTFNTTTGRQLSLFDMGGLNVNEFNKAIDNNETVKAQVGTDYVATKLPKEFYATEGNNVVMIIQQEDGIPHSAGTVYVPVGNLRDQAVAHDAAENAKGKTKEKAKN